MTDTKQSKSEKPDPQPKKLSIQVIKPGTRGKERVMQITDEHD